MKTTEIFAELLVIGLSAGVWIAFAFGAVFGISALQHLSEIARENTALTLLVGIAFAYILGVALDRVYLLLWKHVEAHRMRSHGVDLDAYYDFQIKLAQEGSDALVDFITYYTSRIRLLRASSINFVLAGAFGAYLFNNDCSVAISIFVGFGVMAVVAFTAYFQLAGKLYGFVSRAQDAL